MEAREIKAKSLLRRHLRPDSWFVSSYGMNLFRGCAHNCAYCDGRYEKYQVEGEFGKDVAVKTNAAELLARELDPKRRRKPMARSFVMLGGGVGDSYQEAERRFEVTRAALGIILEFGFPVHVLTKSCLVERDTDLICRINESARAIVSMSLSSVNDETSSIFEPGCAPPSSRLATLTRMKEHGIATGVYLMPAIPFITDTDEELEETLIEVKKARVDFVIFSGMTLKEGRQKDYFMDVLKGYRPELVPGYEEIYKGSSRWGSARPDYYQRINARFGRLARKHGLARRIPTRLYADLMEENHRVMVILENLDYLARLEGLPAPYARAASSISRLGAPISTMRDRLTELLGVGKTTERIILEILDTGGCRFLDELL